MYQLINQTDALMLDLHCDKNPSSFATVAVTKACQKVNSAYELDTASHDFGLHLLSGETYQQTGWPVPQQYG